MFETIAKPFVTDVVLHMYAFVGGKHVTSYNLDF